MKRTMLAALISVMLTIVITAAGFIPEATGHDNVSDSAEDSVTFLPQKDMTDIMTSGSVADCGESETNEGKQYAALPLLPNKKFYSDAVEAKNENSMTAECGDTESQLQNAYPDPEFPSDSIEVSVTVNGAEALDGHAASVDGTTYLPLVEFCGLFFECEATDSDGGLTVSGEGFEVSAKDGERYITSRGRVLWCGMRDSVRRFGDVLCVPAEPICRTFGLSLDVNETQVSISGEAVSISADEVYDAENLYWLSRIISAESRGEPLEGQIGVGCVVLNRMNASENLNSVYDVVFDRQYGIQFSPAYSGSVYNDPTESCVRAAKICLEGYTVSESILYFINSADTPPSWMTEKCRRVMTIGNHDFYA